jgi:hypothetical protein
MVRSVSCGTSHYAITSAMLLLLLLLLLLQLLLFIIHIAAVNTIIGPAILISLTDYFFTFND